MLAQAHKDHFRVNRNGLEVKFRCNHKPLAQLLPERQRNHQTTLAVQRMIIGAAETLSLFFKNLLIRKGHICTHVSGSQAFILPNLVLIHTLTPTKFTK